MASGGYVPFSASTKVNLSGALRVGFLERKPLPDFTSYFHEKVGKWIAAEQRPVEAMTRAERTRFLDALKTYKPHDGVPLLEGTAYRFYVIMH